MLMTAMSAKNFRHNNKNCNLSKNSCPFLLCKYYIKSEAIALGPMRIPVNGA